MQDGTAVSQETNTVDFFLFSHGFYCSTTSAVSTFYYISKLYS